LKHGDAARTEYSPETIIATMDQAGIDQSVVFAMSTTTRRSIEMAELAVRKYPDRLIPYVYALPHYDRPVIKEIQEALSTKGFRGVKIHAGECTLAEYVVDPVLDAAGQCRAPCLVDCAGNYKAARRMAEAFPATKLIVAHMGRYLCKDGQLLDQFIGLAQDLGNVYLDLSGVVLTEKIKQAAAKVGARRLVWGTDGPDRQPDTATFARNELDKIRRLKASDEDKAAILGGTISSLLRLE
jgi:predicted TIM-barrel fold metal-dependent hydrolase